MPSQDDPTLAAGWRPPGELRLHPAIASVPAMAPEEYEAFRADIAERGILVPLEVTKLGTVLDGRNRLRAATDLAIENVPVREVAPPDEHEHVLLVALHRRHLSASQKAALAIELASYRWIGIVG
jgi:ParB-like chromosome segregation protein Spo0J